jgi:hypothetical protein
MVRVEDKSLPGGEVQRQIAWPPFLVLPEALG